MNAPPLLQPPLPAETLERFAAATAGLLGRENATPLGDHLRALAEVAAVEVVLLYHGAAFASAFDLVASHGVPREALPALRWSGGCDDDAAPGHRPDDALGAGLDALGVRARRELPLWADGDCIGRLVFGSRRWHAFHPGALHVLAAAGAQLAVVLARRLDEVGDAKAAWSPAQVPRAGGEPLQFRRRRDRFIALLAHELRNPVAPIRSGLDLLAGGRLDANARQDTVRMMQRQLAQLSHLIDDFLDTARLDADRLHAQRRAVDLRAALATALEGALPAAHAKGQTIVRTGDETGPLVVDADPVRLTQAFAHLLAGGVAATPTAGTLAVRLARTASSASIVFEDEGPPVDTAAADPSDPAPGGDFGLLRGLLALNDATVAASNRDGDGAGRAFTITLPLAEGTVPQGAEAHEPAPGRSCRVLVVDDNVDAAESLGLLLQLDGHEIRVAHDGPGAVSMAAAFRPDVIVMDLGLPGFSGHEAIMRIRSLDGGARPGIVALTGWGTRADRDASARAGADVHLVKPVAHAELREAIERLVQTPPADRP